MVGFLGWYQKYKSNYALRYRYKFIAICAHVPSYDGILYNSFGYNNSVIVINHNAWPQSYINKQKPTKCLHFYKYSAIPN